jgi:6-phosphogluconolactonase (cycloisomerase 2 family)
LVLLTLTGCTVIAVLSGPRSLSSGDTATYVLSLDGPGANDVTLYVVSDVPESWLLLSNSFTGTIGGVPVTGSGAVVTDPHPSSLPPPEDGYQRIWITDGPHDYDPEDSGEIALEFAVNDVPDGEFVLKFWLVSSEDLPGSTGRYAAVTVNREPRLFAFVEALYPADGALDEMPAAVVAPDGRTMIVGGYRESTSIGLSNFDRDPLTGDLEHLHLLDDPDMPYIAALAFSPDSKHVYGVGGQRLACYSRDPASGFVSRFQLLENGVGGVIGLSSGEAVAVSPDGAYAHVAAYSDDAISVFQRSPVTGELAFVEAQINGVNGVQGIDGAIDVVISPDGANLYATGTELDTIAAFDRDQSTGELTFTQVIEDGVGGVTGLDYPRSMAISSDGGTLYVVGTDSDAVAIFDRDQGTGLLSFAGTVSEGIDGVVGLMTPYDLALSSDDRFLFVAASNSFVSFSRDPSTGDLSFLEADFDGEGGVVGLGAPYALTAAPTDHDAFRTAYGVMAVFSDRLFSDGFETGDTTRWSATSP